MWKTVEGSTARLLQLCAGYFVFYVITGVTVRYFQFYPAEFGGPKMAGMTFLTYSTVGGTMICLGWVLAFRWYRLKSNRMISMAGFSFPSEFLYIIPSGICTAVVIPTTTLMYSLKGVSVMVAMVLMRGSVIVISRIVDTLQIRQGIMHKKIYFEENVGVAFALLAVGTKIFWGVFFGFGNSFDFLHSRAAMTILFCYVSAYAFRIYIMNYFKNTRPKGVPYDNKGFFAVEQISASVVLVWVGAGLFFGFLGAGGEQAELFKEALVSPHPAWMGAGFAGVAFGIVAFFSVFIFMFRGRTATFAGLVNRLTSLVAGTTATLIFWVFYRGKFPTPQDWLSLVFILFAVGFMTVAERKRAAELAAESA